MAIAKKCDRCGRLYEPYEGVSKNSLENKYDGFILTTSKSAACHSYDLCFSCMIDLTYWIDSGTKEADNDPN